MGGRTADELTALLGADRIIALDRMANFFGLESKGVRQIRGNGCLAATRDEIVFVMWIPRKEFRIARNRVTGVERARWHLGKSRGRELLRVRFLNDAGAADSVAWFVSDLPKWEAALRN